MEKTQVVFNVTNNFYYGREGDASGEPSAKKARYSGVGDPELGAAASMQGGRYDAPDGLGPECYPMTTKPKGRVLIINNYKFGKKTRHGSKNDVKRLRSLWEKFGAEVIPRGELSSNRIRTQVVEFLGDTTPVSFCAVFIMSHGKEGDLVVGSDNTVIDAEELVNLFASSQCSHLNGVPKLLFFQMCRGARYGTHSGTASPVDRVDGHDSPTDLNWLENMINKCLPMGETLGKIGVDQADAAVERLPGGDEADVDEVQAVRDKRDFLLAFSTLKGEVSFRNTDRGTWLIQEICDVFERFFKDEDVIQMMNTVNGNVAGRRATGQYAGSTNRVIAKHTLTKKLKFVQE